MKKPVNVVITGAAGNIAYSAIFRVASGQMLGNDQPVNLKSTVQDGARGGGGGSW